ncbi:hypothetical protein [Nannocystis pusilla]|uniref:hypothetical protein n=1 Tax=Nannocystis pusilla TaxID=889268 RepID=UPI003B7D4A6E
MTVRHEIAIILTLAAACGDSGGPDTGSSNTTPTTVQMTDALSTTTSDTTNSSSSPNTHSDPSGDSTMSTLGTTSTGESAPVFLSLSTNPKAITEGDSFTVTAILTDPDGVDDIVGGSLLNVDGSAEFGPFIAAGTEGTYSVTLSWAQIHQAESIHFENMVESRDFNARFFDQAGNSTTKTVSVSLECESGSACEGVCTDLSSDTINCGTCGHPCSLACVAGKCGPSWSQCIGGDDGFSTCTQVCQSVGQTCAESQCGGVTVQTFDTLSECNNDENGEPFKQSCDAMQDWADPAIKCCCTSSE